MNYHELFGDLSVPVIVFRDAEPQTILYRNRSATLLLDPLSKNEAWDSIGTGTLVTDTLRMPEERYREFLALLHQRGSVSDFPASLRMYSGEIAMVKLSANRLGEEDDRRVKLSVSAAHAGQLSQLNTQAVATALNLAYRSKTTEDAVRNILTFAGCYTDVSRCYIFESTSETTTSNTYEWCAEGVAPSIDQLKNLPKDEYSYDEIIRNGLAVTDDIRKLSPADRAILEPQGIKALAVVPILSYHGPLGYVGFDDCKRYRNWSQGEVQLLQELSDILASLLSWRDVERGLQYSLEILKTVTDSVDNIVLVADLHSQSLLFANSALARAVGAAPQELQGRPVTEVLRGWAPNIDISSAMEALVRGGDAEAPNTRSWEFQNETNGRWYLMRDAIITWIDGRDVLIETATDISHQKEHETQLQHAATTDLMTGLYNREWGRFLLQQILDAEDQEQATSLVFLDLDNLKRVNDRYGHAAGDQMILDTVNCIRSSVRKSDVLCRWGGDEFILVIRATQSQTELVLKKILEKMEAHNRASDGRITLGFSYGIVEMGGGQQRTVDDLIAVADGRMYLQKTQKKQDSLRASQTE